MQGITVFRMQRSEEFQRAMLHFVGRFHASYVCRGVKPPVNVHADVPDYRAFLHLTARIARQASVVMHIHTPAKAANNDKRTFL